MAGTDSPGGTAQRSDIASPESFQYALERLLRTAEVNGIDVYGSWPVLSDDPDRFDWEVQITQLARRE